MLSRELGHHQTVMTAHGGVLSGKKMGIVTVTMYETAVKNLVKFVLFLQVIFDLSITIHTASEQS